jgi:hypothetical protein
MTVDIIITVAAIITALGVIFGGVYATFRLLSRVSQAIGVDSRGRTLSERLDRVEHQLWENGGSSLADRVNTINEHSVKTAAEVELIKDLLISGRTEPVQIVRKTRQKKAI